MEPAIQPAAIAAIAGILGAVIGASTALTVNLLGMRQAVLERKRRACAEAVADALAWLELPYRVRRRPDDASETLRLLADRMHHLQERLTFHESWLRIELPAAQAKYGDLVNAVKASTHGALQQAWATPPASSGADMNIGDLALPPPTPSVEAFSNEVRRRLVWWRLWE